MPKTWLRIALLNFFIAAVMGAILRYAFVEEISWLKYRPFQHGHSHVAMLGWLYLGLYALLVHAFLPEAKQADKFYRDNFLLTQLSVVGMLIAFPWQGYGGWSIAFSTMHGLLSYFFAWRLWQDSRDNQHISGFFARAALVFMLLSTLALWAMPIIMLKGLQGKAIYYMAVQFYLHFQFNGWFLFAGLALFFRLLENGQISLPARPVRWFFWLLAISCFLTYALAVAWSNPSAAIFALNSSGVVVQLIALLLIFMIIREAYPALNALLTGWSGFLIRFAGAGFALKILIQAAVVIPYLATVSYTIRGYVVGFVHLILLGVMTPLLLGFAARSGLLNLRAPIAKAGIILLLAGFLGSEALLFLQGTLLWGAKGFLPHYPEMLFGVSVLMPLGVGGLLAAAFWGGDK